MNLTVREMMGSEVDVIIQYFQSATPEHLETLGVDPTRMPPVEGWRERLAPMHAPDRSESYSSGRLAVGRPRDRLLDVRQNHFWRAGEHAPARRGPGAEASRHRCRMRAAQRPTLF